MYSTPSARSTRSLLRRFTMATTRAPRALTRSTVRLVSVVVPDWLIATTRVSDMSAARPKPDSSVAGQSSTSMDRSGAIPASSASSARDTEPPATAAVPWPMTRTRRIVPSASPARTSTPNASSPRRTCQSVDPASSAGPVGTNRPRRVARTESGDSPISFSRKWGWSPRSMSRVVISARTTSSPVTGNRRPS